MPIDFKRRLNHFGWLLFVGLLIFLVLLGLSWAGIRHDSRGNTISEDVLSPAGGLHIFAGNDTGMTDILGQASAGTSHSPSGSDLYHGVYALSAGYPTGLQLR